MEPEKLPPLPLLPSITTLNLPTPVISAHSYTLYHQKKHLMLINGEQDFASENEELSRKRQVNLQDYASTNSSQEPEPKLINITTLKRCERCQNWIPETEMREHMTFHGAIILDYLFLGDKFSSQSRKQLLQRLQVTHVVNAASELPNPFVSEGIKYFHMSLMDNMTEDVIEPCEKAAEFIETVFSEGGKVFVHCAMGKSRSVAVILIYLMKYKAFSLEAALSLVKEKRHIIKPNPRYLKQLQNYDSLLQQARKQTKTEST